MKLEDKILWGTGIICFCVFCIGGFLLLNYFTETRKQEKLSEELSRLKHGYSSDTFIIVEGEPLEKESISGGDTELPQPEEDGAQKTEPVEDSVTLLREINPDYVFWLQIPNTNIDYPVVYKDNSYYLKRDFYGNKNKHGTIFLDERCGISEDFLLIHGHNMKDGTMFGGLRDFKKSSFREAHKELFLSGEQGAEAFLVVAGAVVDLYDTNRFVYEKLPQTEAEAQDYLAELKAHALWCENFDWEFGRRVIILSTCDYGSEEERFIVIAVEND